ncbi:MAG: gliding motility-associated C-terminal domain-containing protein [Endomicrobiales bacterium]
MRVSLKQFLLVPTGVAVLAGLIMCLSYCFARADIQAVNDDAHSTTMANNPMDTKPGSIYCNRLDRSLSKKAPATTFTLTSVYPQIFTPNGDNRNDYVQFQFENPQDANPSGKIYNLHGAAIGEMKAGVVYDSLIWDGTTYSGSIALPGAYVYQIEVTGSESKVYTGVVVLAK